MSREPVSSAGIISAGIEDVGHDPCLGQESSLHRLVIDPPTQAPEMSVTDRTNDVTTMLQGN